MAESDSNFASSSSDDQQQNEESGIDELEVSNFGGQIRESCSVDTW